MERWWFYIKKFILLPETLTPEKGLLQENQCTKSPDTIRTTYQVGKIMAIVKWKITNKGMLHEEWVRVSTPNKIPIFNHLHTLFDLGMQCLIITFMILFLMLIYVIKWLYELYNQLCIHIIKFLIYRCLSIKGNIKISI